jgi:hypothetical protein
MKRFYIICFCLAIFFQASSQNDIDTVIQFNYIPSSPLKASIHLSNNTVTTGTIVQIIDSVLILSVSSEKENTITYSRSIISIKEIKIIKIKRKAFWLGTVTGGVITGAVGYGVGSSSYYDDPLLSDAENEDKANLKGYEGALIGAVPGAVIGSLVGSIVVKRKFIINGDIKNIKAMVKAVKKFKSHI